VSAHARPDTLAVTSRTATDTVAGGTAPAGVPVESDTIEQFIEE
jgi:hypothetical protein